MNKFIFPTEDSKSLVDTIKIQEKKIQSIRKFSLPVWQVSPLKITRIFLLAIILIIIGHILEKLMTNWLNTFSPIVFSPRLFDFDTEGNIPALYSTISLGFCSLLLAIIASFEQSVNSQYAKFWQGLSFIFLFLAVDEACSIHEELIPILRTAFNTKGLLFFPWVIPAVILLIIFLVVFRGFIINLPPKIRHLFLVAGSIYVGGAIGMELIGGYFADVYGFNTKAYWLASTTEELLEMFGIVVFIYGLLSYIKSNLTEFHFSVSFRKQKQLR